MAQITIKYKNASAANVYKGLHLNNTDVPRDEDKNPTLTDQEFLKFCLERIIKNYELDGRRQAKKEELQAMQVDDTVIDLT